MTIQESYGNKNIFITGGSGFIGKAIIEKILRNLADVNTIYILMREKKGKGLQERLQDIFNLKLFNQLQETNPNVFNKVVAVNGDVSELELGLNEDAKKELIENVHIVIHSAASIRFDDTLKNAIILNTRGTREVVQLASQMKNLTALVHISTAYCVLERENIEEKAYRSALDWKDAIRMAEEIEDEYAMDICTKKMVFPFPNTYTFSKLLAENVVTDLCNGKIPVLIVRPTIVSPAYLEPYCGWSDNLNGSVGIVIGCLKGIRRIINIDPKLNSDLVPVDCVVRTILVATHLRANDKNYNKVSIYNAASHGALFCHPNKPPHMEETTWKLPVRQLLWFPRFHCFTNAWIFNAAFIIFQVIPALVFDLVSTLIGKKPQILRISRKLYIFNMALKHFLLHKFVVHNKNMFDLDTFMEEKEKPYFSLQVYNIQEDYQLREYIEKSFVTVLKEQLNGDIMVNVEKSKRKIWCMYILDRSLVATLFMLFCWFTLTKFFIPKVM